MVLIGNGSSAKDILKEISPLASQVHQAIRGPDSQLKRLENHDNAWQHSMVSFSFSQFGLKLNFKLVVFFPDRL